MKKIALAVAAVLLVASVNLASAKSYEANISAGVAIPMGDLADGFSTGFGAQGSGLYKVAPSVLIGPTVSYFSFSDKFDAGFTWGSLELMAQGKFVLGKSSAKPYLLAGLGFASSSVSFAGYSASATDFMIQPGAGVQFGTGNVGFFAEVKYSMVMTDGSSTTYLPITAGVSF